MPPQRVRLGVITLDIPEGFKDRTLYAFRAPDRKEELLIEPSVEHEIKTADALVHDRFGEVKGFFKDAAQVDLDAPRTIGGRPAHAIVYALKDKNESATMGIAAALLAPPTIADTQATFIEFKYSSKLPVKQARPRYEAMLDSVVLSQAQAQPRPLQAGAARQFLVSGTIDVPDTMIWSAPYLLVNQAAKLRLGIAASRLGLPIKPVTLPRDKDDPQRLALIESPKTEFVQVAGSRSELEQYTRKASPSRSSDKPEAVARVDAVIDAAFSIQLELRGPASATDQIVQQLRTLASTVQVSG